MTLSPIAKGTWPSNTKSTACAVRPTLSYARSIPSKALRNRVSWSKSTLIGPTLLEILRARGFLSPAETWLLLNLLAPVADDAQSNELQQVDFTLSGIQLTSPRLTETWTASDVLRHPLTRWEQLGVKVPAVDFSLSVSDTATWGGAATLIQAVPGGGPRASYLRLLSLLVYELLGGPRSTLELTGRYSPVAGLSEQGNALLRRGLLDDFQSATELARQLGGEIVARNVDPVTTTPAPASSPELSLGKFPSATPVSSSPPTPARSFRRPAAFSGPVHWSERETLTDQKHRHSRSGCGPGSRRDTSCANFFLPLRARELSNRRLLYLPANQASLLKPQANGVTQPGLEEALARQSVQRLAGRRWQARALHLTVRRWPPRATKAVLHLTGWPWQLPAR